ncbi:hypothetical protein E2P81_ATG03823 [Venturia nashicola]|nr:hypothetical protein E2P81_ATG03823 [Venturia nashicola]
MFTRSESISSHAQTRFVHEALDTSQQQIRLLRLQAEEYEAPNDLTPKLIDCEICHFNLETIPPYRAISYTWGDPDTTIVITVNKRQFHVRDNLWDFLDVARDEFQGQWLWIDALCIDQENVGERNHQVQLMKNIFSGAQAVVSWLGSAADESDIFMELVECYAVYLTKQVSPLLLPMDEPVMDIYEISFGWQWKLGLEDKENDPIKRSLLHLLGKSQGAIQAFLNRPYWQRIWIVQEVRFAQAHFIMCGRQTTTSTNLNTFITQMKKSIDLIFRRNPNSTIKENLWFPYPYAVLNPPVALTEFSLSNVVRTYRGSQCTDIRDRVYGIMSLVNERTRIPVDYSKSTFELFFMTLGKVIQTEWGHESKDAKEFPDELKKALGLDDTAVNPNFVRLFVQCGIKYRPRLLTLEKWLEIVERRKRRDGS